MSKILNLLWLSVFLIVTVGCFRTEGQQNIASDSAKQKAAPVLAESESNQAHPVTLAEEQDRINELADMLGLQRMPAGTSIVDFELADLQSKLHKLSSYKGSVVFLNFWATWCPPCKAEMPDMQKLHDNFKDKKFKMLAVDLQESKAAVSAFVKKYGYTFTVLLDTNGNVGRIYGTASIPITVLIDKKGNILYGAMGGRPWAAPEAMELINLLIEMPE